MSFPKRWRLLLELVRWLRPELSESMKGEEMMQAILENLLLHAYDYDHV